MEKINNFNSITTSEQTDRQKRLKESGQQDLRKIGLEPDNYQKYTNLMRLADAPIGQALGVLKYLDGVIITPNEAVEAWSMIQNIFNKINTNDYNQETGQAILIEMKQLTTACLNYLKELAENYKDKEITEPIRLSADMLMITKRLNELKEQFGQLPAYLTYRKVGIYDIKIADLPNDAWFRETPNQTF